jgi:hypothetical protein
VQRSVDDDAKLQETPDLKPSSLLNEFS